MDFVIDKEYRVGEVFKHKQTGKTLLVIPFADGTCRGCPGFGCSCVSESSSSRCFSCDRKDGAHVSYKEVTKPAEGMLYSKEEQLFRLGQTYSGDCACSYISGGCETIDKELFGSNQREWAWNLVKEETKDTPAPTSTSITAPSGRTVVISNGNPTATKRKLVLSDAVIRSGDQVTFSIKEQTHRDDEFTPGGMEFKATNGVILVSAAGPEVRQYGDRMFVRGCNKEWDNHKLTCSSAFFEKIKEAIKEYNETDGMGYPKPVAKPPVVEPPVVKRFIKLGDPWYEDGKAFFIIREQSHVWYEFTPSGSEFVASNGYKLMSVRVPDSTVGIARCFVRGENKEKDFSVLCMACAEYDKFVFAVNEYNETDGCGKKPVVKEEWPKDGDNYFLVESAGSVEEATFMHIWSQDVKRKELGNCFRTKGQAELAAKELRSFFKDFNERLSDSEKGLDLF